MALPAPLAPLEPLLPAFSVHSRGMGVRLCATRGAGKSRLLGRALAYVDLLLNLPLVIIDPVGAVADNLYDAIDRESTATKQQLLPRLRYVNMAGQRVGDDAYVVPLPFLYRSGEESLYAVAYRFLDVIRKSDPALQSASILGWNALAHIGERVLMALAAMGCQITEADHLLTNPQAWEPKLREAERRVPEVAPVVAYLLGEYATLPPREKLNLTSAFKRKLSVFDLDPVIRAQYGASLPAIDPQRVIDERLCVIFDFRDVTLADQKRLGILWVYKYFVDFFQLRGPDKHKVPVSFIIDELSYLVPGRDGNSLLRSDLSDLIQRTARNASVWVTLSHQELRQFDEETNDLLMQLGTQILGATSDMQGARQVADRFYEYDPYWVKDSHDQFVTYDRVPEKVGEIKTYFSIDEQVNMNALEFIKLETFNFLVGIAKREGQLPTFLRHVDLSDFDRDKFPRRERVDAARAALMQQHGQKVTDILGEITGRLPGNGDGRSPGNGAAPPPDDAPPFRTRVRGPRTSAS